MTEDVQPSGDYWYINRDQLRIGQIFRSAWSGGFVMLDGRVPGDGTKLYVADRYDGDWCFQDSTAEPGDLVGYPITEEELLRIEQEEKERPK